MSVNRLGRGVDLVKPMQPRSDLQEYWVIFDHIKQVPKWTTMTALAYNRKYYKVMTIALYNMQSEDAKAQQLFGMNLNLVVRTNGVPNTN